jgi:branched-chain amino acid transport system substrate-binding protein
MQVPAAPPDQAPVVPSFCGQPRHRLHRRADRRGTVLRRSGACLCLLFALSLQSRAEPPLRIGVLTDMNGPYADSTGAGSVAAAQLAVADFGPTVLGRPIEIIAADHQNKPDLAVSIARTWFDTEGVDMVTDLTNSSVAIAVQALATEKHKVDIITSTATTAVTEENCSPTGMHWTFDSYVLTVGTGWALVEAGAKKWFFITADYTFGANLQKTATQEIEQAGGQVEGSMTAPLNTTDFASQLVAAQASGADVVGLANCICSTHPLEEKHLCANGL